MAGEIIPTAWVDTVIRDHEQRVAASPLRAHLREYPESPVSLLDDPEKEEEVRRALEEAVRCTGVSFDDLADAIRKMVESAQRARPQIGVWVCSMRAMRRAETNARLQRWRERAMAGELP